MASPSPSLRLRHHHPQQQDHHSHPLSSAPNSSNSSLSPPTLHRQHQQQQSHLPLTSTQPPFPIHHAKRQGHFEDAESISSTSQDSRHGKTHGKHHAGVRQYLYHLCRILKGRIQSPRQVFLLAWILLLTLYLVWRWTWQGMDYLQDSYQDYQRQQELLDPDNVHAFQPRYTIPLQHIPSFNWPVMTRTLFRPHNPRIVRQAKNAITEWGNEIRTLLGSHHGMAQQYLTPWELQEPFKSNINHDKDEALEFRQRLKAKAPWLKGDFQQDPSWPLSLFPDPVQGQALVMSGGDKQLIYLKALVYTVRVIHQSNIPIRIVYRDSQDLTEPSRREIRQLLEDHLNNDKGNDLNVDIQFLDLSNYFDLEAVGIKGWNLKAFGMLAVPETQVAFLDADVLLLRPPEDLFQAQGYQRTGALFFHDRVKPQFYWDVHVFAKWLQPNLALSAKFQKLLVYGDRRFSAYSEQVQEAGVLLVDKTRRSRGIWAACLIFGRPDIRQYIQTDHMYGDKEVYWTAMEALADDDDEHDDDTYEFARYYPGVIGGTVTDFARRTAHVALDASPEQIQSEFAASVAESDALCGRLLHLDDDGVPLWANGGYMLKEDDWFSSAAASQSAINPVWFVDGGDGQTEGFPNPWWPWGRNILQWYGTLRGQNQVWALDRAMGVECLSPNSRQLRTVPMEIADSARQAVRYYFDERVKSIPIVDKG